VSLPPAVSLPPGTKKVSNRAGHFVVLNPIAAEKLKYWIVYRNAAGQYRAKFATHQSKSKNDHPLESFGAYVLVHLQPHTPSQPPIDI
jgi:hypothetical protein